VASGSGCFSIKPQRGLIVFQRLMGILAQQPALPLRPQPNGAAERQHAADQRIDQARYQKMRAVQRQQLQGVNRRDRKANHRQPVVLARNQVGQQRDHQHDAQRFSFRQLQLQQPGRQQ